MTVFAPAEGGIGAEGWVSIDRIPIDDQYVVRSKLLDEEHVWTLQSTELHVVLESIDNSLPEATARIRPRIAQYQHAEPGVLLHNRGFITLLLSLRLSAAVADIGRAHD